MIRSRRVRTVRGQLVGEKAMIHRERSAGWVKVPVLETFQRVICGATNRVFVGVPLCP